MFLHLGQLILQRFVCCLELRHSQTEILDDAVFRRRLSFENIDRLGMQTFQLRLLLLELLLQLGCQLLLVGGRTLGILFDA